MGTNSPDYLTYKKNKQKLERSDKKTSKLKVITWVFVITFSLFFAIFTNFVAKYTTKMDIEYDKNATTDQGQAYIDNAFGTDSLLSARDADEKNRVIDRRLRLIQLEESAPYEAKVINKDSNSVIDREHYEKITLGDDYPSSNKPKIKSINTEKTPDTPKPEPSISQADPIPQTFSKVLVGKYHTFEEAKIAQVSLRNSGQAGTPFIRKIGETYTLQIGSYVNPDIAKSVAQSYSDLSFEVWIIQH